MSFKTKLDILEKCIEFKPTPPLIGLKLKATNRSIMRSLMKSLTDWRQKRVYASKYLNLYM